MSARRDARDPGEAQAVRRRQLLLFSAAGAVALVALAAWLGMGGGTAPAPQGGIDAGIVAPDAAEKVWTRRSEARLGGIETRLREMEQEARSLRGDNDRLRARLEADAADARSVIDRQAALIDELRRGLPASVQPGGAPGAGPESGDYFRGESNAPATGGQAQPAQAMPGRMIETFELDGASQSSAIDPRSGPELVADAVAKPVSAWLPAGAHAQAVVLAGVDASAGVSSQGDPRPVLLRIMGPAWTAAEDGTAMQVDVDGCTVAEGGSCGSVAAADPAVPDPDAAHATALAEPLWRVRGGEPGTQASAPPCDAGCDGGFDPFAWLARLFAAEAHDGEARPAGRPAPAAQPSDPVSRGEADAPAGPSAALPDEAGPSRDGPGRDGPAAAFPAAAERAGEDPDGGALRTGEVVARIWIAPFVDANGVYREGAYVRVVLEPAGWRLP